MATATGPPSQRPRPNGQRVREAIARAVCESPLRLPLRFFCGVTGADRRRTDRLMRITVANPDQVRQRCGSGTRPGHRGYEGTGASATVSLMAVQLENS